MLDRNSPLHGDLKPRFALQHLKHTKVRKEKKRRNKNENREEKIPDSIYVDEDPNPQNFVRW